jgi:hypothetical protein
VVREVERYVYFAGYTRLDTNYLTRESSSSHGKDTRASSLLVARKTCKSTAPASQHEAYDS